MRTTAKIGLASRTRGWQRAVEVVRAGAAVTVPLPSRAARVSGDRLLFPFLVGLAVVAGLGGIAVGAAPEVGTAPAVGESNAWVATSRPSDFYGRAVTVQEPPVETPPVETPPVQEPPVETPPVETPPVETPPVETPPVDTPPVETPPVEAPPMQEPPVETPPVQEAGDREPPMVGESQVEGESRDSGEAEASESAVEESAEEAGVIAASAEDVQFQQVVLGKVEPTLSDLRQLQRRVNDLVEKLRPAVVGIRMGGGQGSGVIVSGDGYILTAAHVVGQKGQRAEIVMPDGSTHRAIVLGTDAGSDAGMLRMVDKGPWPYVEIGESESLLRGQWLLALGHPGGFDPDRHSVVRVGRLLADPGRTTLQTDCTLVGGDSGGPLFDLDGRVVGIHSRISRRIQQNYHVSMDIYTSQWDEMSKEPAPTLGFRIKPAGETSEVVIDRVVPDGPADKGGLKVGDRILKLAGKDVTNREDLRAGMEGLRVDQKVKVTVIREGAEMELELTVQGR